MAQSPARIYLHLVFSTKNRERWLDDDLRPGLFAYLATLGRDFGCEVYRVGGISDHVHLAIDLGRTITVADLVGRLKSSSSVWLRKQRRSHEAFEWQAGYGAFSVGQSNLPALLSYIDEQETHHRRVGFQDEYRALLAKYGVKGDERYLWIDRFVPSMRPPCRAHFFYHAGPRAGPGLV